MILGVMLLVFTDVNSIYPVSMWLSNSSNGSLEGSMMHFVISKRDR